MSINLIVRAELRTPVLGLLLWSETKNKLGARKLNASWTI